jgi:hypothetical protein
MSVQGRVAVMALARWRRRRMRVLANPPGARVSGTPRKLQAWAAVMDLERRVDGRTPSEVARLIDWCEAHGSRRSVILSAGAPRKKWEQLVFWGPQGRGTTHLLAAVANEPRTTGRRALHVVAPGILSRPRAAEDAGGSRPALHGGAGGGRAALGRSLGVPRDGVRAGPNLQASGRALHHLGDGGAGNEPGGGEPPAAGARGEAGVPHYRTSTAHAPIHAGRWTLGSTPDRSAA